MTLKLATFLILVLAALPRAQAAQFFQIVGPGATTITSADVDGFLSWANTTFPATITIQTTSSLVSPVVWTDYIQVPVTAAATTVRVLDPNPPTDMAFIPAGLFTMGDTFGDGSNYELPLHDVIVSEFYLDKYEVTKTLWDEVYNWATNNGYSFQYPARGKSSHHPAHSMSWADAVKWCNARSEREGRVPAYYTSAAQTTVYRGFLGIMDASWVKWDAGYRLPTEAEWEKAARGGASGRRFPWTSTDNISHSRANYEANPLSADPQYGDAYDLNPTRSFHPTFNDGVFPYTSPVGYFAPNGYGLYDMPGNVMELCWDWYSQYSSSLQTDPRGGPREPGPDVAAHAIRGGGWARVGSTCRSAGRFPAGQNNADHHTGFRCVLPPP